MTVPEGDEMSDRRPEKPHMKDRVLTTSRWNQTFDEWEDTEAADLAKVLAYDPVAAVAAVRRGVESGTIEGFVVSPHIAEGDGPYTPNLHLEPGKYLVVPVVDPPGEEER